MAGKLIAVVAVTGALVLLPIAAAQGDTANILEPQHAPATAADGFQAGPCTTDLPLCSPQTPQQFFKQAGGHPPGGFVQFIVRHTVGQSNGFPIEPLVAPLESRVIKDVRVDLPPGLSVNPEATPSKCSMSDFLHVFDQGRQQLRPLCGPGTRIGETAVVAVTGPDGWPALSLAAGQRLPNLQNPLYNLQPGPGEPALFGAVVGEGVVVLLRPELAWDTDYHESFSILALPDYKTARVLGIPEPAPIGIHTARLVTNGTAGDGTLATNPTTCFNPDDPQFAHIYSSWIREDSYGEPNPSFPFGSTAVEQPLPTGIHPDGCAAVPFSPTLEFDPGSLEADSPSAPTVTLRLRVENPSRGGGRIAESHLRSAEVTLPEGLGLNPAAAPKLATCSDAQFHKGERVVENQCPAGSALGSAEIRSPVLATPLLGNVYLGEQKSADPASGEEFRLLVEAKAPERGVVVRLIGNLAADPRSGQLTARFDEQERSPLFGALPHGLPQLPLESVRLAFSPALGALTTPSSCAPGVTRGAFEPWSAPGTNVSLAVELSLQSGPGGSECASSLAERAFAPLFSTVADNDAAGAYTPLRIHIVRPEGQQELKRLDLSLPAGLLGRLAGIPYCPDAAIAAAAGRSAASELAAPSCAAASQVGVTSTEAGSGGEPLRLPGRVYLAGPYRGAPLSLVAITPAAAGPFDLGNVVIRIALNVDPVTTKIRASSDVIPDVFGGAKLDLRAIDLNLDRDRFILNPTSCAEGEAIGRIEGGGDDPTDPSRFSSAPLSSPLQTSGCSGLAFAPTLTTTISGAKRRGGFPALTAVLAAQPGEANLARATLTLPHSFFVAQEHLADICTRAQLASHGCPASSVYGEAEASSPLLDGKLSGPVYLVPGGGQLPDLVVDLHGQIDLQLRGTISSKGGKIETTFAAPDVPVREFALRLSGGRKGLLVNSANLCKGPQRGTLALLAQNGRQVTTSGYRLAVESCPKKKHRRHRRHRGHRKHGRR